MLFPVWGEVSVWARSPMVGAAHFTSSGQCLRLCLSCLWPPQVAGGKNEWESEKAFGRMSCP